MTTQIAPRKASREETALFPFTPFRFGGISSLIDRMRSDFDRMLNRFDSGWGQTWEENGASWGMDIRDEEDALVVVAETPGFAAADFDLRIQENQLILRAAHKAEQKEKGAQAVQDRQYYESVLLPSGLDKEKVEASYQNGVLTVRLPKTAEGKPRKIAIKAL